MPPLVLPRRYEALEAEAKVRSLPLRPLVRPVREALTDIERDIRLVRETGMGRLYVINGVTGSGKTTFLNSLSLYIDDIQVHNVKGMSLEHRGAVENSLALLRRDLSVVSVVVLEGREAPGSLHNEELDLLLTTINSDFRSDTGRKTLFVIPTTSPALAQQISARAAEIGGMTSRERPFFVFSGPPRGQYIEIVNETLAVCRRESHGGKIPSFLNPFQLVGGAPDGSIIPPGSRSGKKIGCFRSLRQTARCLQ